MYINDKSYGDREDLITISSFRYLLNTSIYNQIDAINDLSMIIGGYIDCLTMDYNNMNRVFTIKIKKTSMKKMYSFQHNTAFYYNIIPSIFKDFLNKEKDSIIALLRTTCNNPIQTFNNIISKDNIILSGLCEVTCVSDNIIFIKL